jgi:tRNA threonylcarbamoyladenosine biosynthesis protein TsaE
MTKPQQVYRSVAISGLEDVAQAIAGNVKEYKVWLFHGEMGSGKTTLIKEVCKVLHVTDAMSSPTFSIVNEYEAGDGSKVFHFDFYRIKNEAEAFDIGTEEYFYSGFPCFVEWPEKIPVLIPDTYGEVNLSFENKTERTIAISLHDGEEKNRI